MYFHWQYRMYGSLQGKQSWEGRGEGRSGIDIYRDTLKSYTGAIIDRTRRVSIPLEMVAITEIYTEVGWERGAHNLPFIC